MYTFADRDPRHAVLSEFRYQELGGRQGKGRRTIYAKAATYSGGLWHLRDGQLRTDGPNITVEPFVQKTIALPGDPAAFFVSSSLNFVQPILTLARQALVHGKPGHRRAVLDLNSRLSFLLLGLPLLCLALPVILCFELGRTGLNLALAVPVSAGLAFLVWGVWSGLQALAQVTTLSAVAASWSIHLLCIIGGAMIMRRRS